MKYWWVNQRQTYNRQIPGGFMWCPLKKSNDTENRYYNFLNKVSPGDIVFSYAHGHIKAVGIALSPPTVRKNPAPGIGSKNWGNDGYHVNVDYVELGFPVSPKAHMTTIAPVLPEVDSPVKPSGDGKELYITSIPNSFANAIIAIISSKLFNEILEKLRGEKDFDEADIEKDIDGVKGRIDIDTTTKLQLIQARRGQGIFKKNIQLNESKCRITGISNINHLRASHIKPWKPSDDLERLDGCNGLLLAPHIDHLFDGGWISFNDNGGIIVSKKLATGILESWGISETSNTGEFNLRQQLFLDYHRKNILKK